MVNWCPRCQTALSDLEVKHEESDGNLWHIRYPLKDGSRNLVVATTRPETMLGDTAVAVNPKDPRYSDLAGTTAMLPLMNREIPIIFDELADPQFGTGVVKVTPAHDPNDLEAGQAPQSAARESDRRRCAHDRRSRPLRWSGPLRGPQARGGRSRKARGSWKRSSRYPLAISKCDRCGTIVEPLVSTQWFVKTKPMAAKVMDAVNGGRIALFPRTGTRRSSTGWRTSATGAFRGSSGGVIVFRPGTAPIAARSPWRAKRPACMRSLRIVAHRAGSGCARHLVQLRLMAVFDHGLAGRHRRPADLLSDVAADHRLRHPVLLGARMMMLGLELTARFRFAKCNSRRWCAIRNSRRCPRPRATSWTRWTSTTNIGTDAVRLVADDGRRARHRYHLHRRPVDLGAPVRE